MTKISSQEKIINLLPLPLGYLLRYKKINLTFNNEEINNYFYISSSVIAIWDECK